jgi:hypothetical protein
VVVTDLSLLTLLAIAQTVAVYGGVIVLPDGRTVRIAREDRRASVGGEARIVPVPAEDRFVAVHGRGNG